MAAQDILVVILAAVAVVALGFAFFHAIGVGVNQRKPEALIGTAAWLVVPELFLKNRGDHHLKRLVMWVLILVPCGIVFAILVT